MTRILHLKCFGEYTRPQVLWALNWVPGSNSDGKRSKIRPTDESLRETKPLMTKEAFLPLYLSLVRPIPEFATQAASPYLQKDIDLTERLQKLATRLVKGLWHFLYEQRLEILGLPS